MVEKTMLNTREIADFLDINEKMVYTLISDKGLPATKVTGKWLFPLQLVEQWLENQTINFPAMSERLSAEDGLLVISGSNDILLDRAISLFNKTYPSHSIVFGNLGSLGGIRALRRGLCHIASSHLLQENGEEYNFGFAQEELGQMPAVVNFCQREQGLLIRKGNPKQINGISDLARPDIRIVNRPLGTGTRHLFDQALRTSGIAGEKISGYGDELYRHLDVGLEVLAGRADAAPGIKAVAGLLDLDFHLLRRERFDLMMMKDRFFDQGVQLFVGLLHEAAFRELERDLIGYDLSGCGKMVYPQQT
jgi:excisionase family DNA binding protein